MEKIPPFKVAGSRRAPCTKKAGQKIPRGPPLFDVTGEHRSSFVRQKSGQSSTAPPAELLQISIGCG